MQRLEQQNDMARLGLLVRNPPRALTRQRDKDNDRLASIARVIWHPRGSAKRDIERLKDFVRGIVAEELARQH